MSLDSAVDAQVAALLTLVQGAVNADLTAALGQDAIDGVHGHPLPLSILSNTKMPALAIWRQVERWEQKTIHHVEHVVTFRFDYYSKAVPIAKLDLRWPLLHAVQLAMFKAVCAGHHAAVSANAEILRAAGVMDVDVDSFRTNYLFAPEGETAIPAFQASATLRHRDEIDISALQDLVDLHAFYNIDGGNLPLAEDIVAAT